MEENKYKKYINKSVDFIKYKLLPRVQQQKILTATIAGIIILLGITIPIPTPGKKIEESQSSHPSLVEQIIKTLPFAANQTKKETTPAQIPPDQKKENQQNQQLASSSQFPTSKVIKLLEITPTTPPATQSQKQNQTQPASINNQSSSTGQADQNSGGSSGTQANKSTSTSPQYSGATNPPQIIFIGTDGQKQVYTPPNTPPVDITWARYINKQEHYSIEYPANWQVVTKTNAGHEQTFIYMPGADINDPNVQHISYGWATTFSPPQSNYSGPFVLDGVQGILYTNGSAGTSYIAASFQYANGYLILNNNISEEIFTYVFNYMLLSLDFNPS